MTGSRPKAHLQESPAGVPDAELARRCLAGDERAWEGFVDRFRRPIWRIAYRFTGNADDADELTQEIFMRLLTVLPGYRPTGALGAWVRQVASNAAIDHWRRRRRSPTFVSDEALPEPAEAASQRPDVITARREEAARVRRLLDTLPRELAEPVILRDLMDFDYPDIAERLGIPLGTVKSRIHRGRHALVEARRNLESAAARRARRAS